MNRYNFHSVIFYQERKNPLINNEHFQFSFLLELYRVHVQDSFPVIQDLLLLTQYLITQLRINILHVGGEK